MSFVTLCSSSYVELRVYYKESEGEEHGQISTSNIVWPFDWVWVSVCWHTATTEDVQKELNRQLQLTIANWTKVKTCLNCWCCSLISAWKLFDNSKVQRYNLLNQLRFSIHSLWLHLFCYTLFTTLLLLPDMRFSYILQCIVLSALCGFRVFIVSARANHGQTGTNERHGSVRSVVIVSVCMREKSSVWVSLQLTR